MATIDPSAAALLKARYAETLDENVYTNNPVLNLITKKFGVGGSSYVYPIQVGSVAARGKRYATALALAATSQKVSGSAVPMETYAMALAGGLDAALATGGSNSVVDLLGVEQEVAQQGLANMIEQQICGGDSFGTIATVASVVSGTTATVVLQLDNNGDAFSIFVGDSILFKSNPAGGSLVSSTAASVTGTDPILGQITVNANGIDLSGTAGYGIGLAATYAASTAQQTINSLRTMFTRTNLSATYDGITTRATDPVRLAGHVVNVGNMSARDAIALLLASVSQFSNAKSKYALVSPNTMLELQQDLGSSVRYTSTSGSGGASKANIEFDTISYLSPAGMVTVVACPKIKDKDIFVIDPSTLQLNCVESDIIVPVDGGENGSSWIRLQTADSWRLDLRAFNSFVCTKFLANARAIRS